MITSQRIKTKWKSPKNLLAAVLYQQRKKRRLLNNGDTLPTEGLAAAFLIENGLIDNIGISSIELTTGTVEDLPSATWSFPSNAVTLQADTDLGGDVLFDSANAMAPIVRSGAQWYALLNSDYAWVGFHASRGGVVIYSADMSDYATRIQNYLGRFVDTPDQFTIIDQTGVELSTLITSAPVTVAGLEANSIISITGGTYRLNGTGDFTATAGTFAPTDTFEVQVTSDDDYETAVNAVVDINGVSDTFTVTTRAEITDAITIQADGWTAVATIPNAVVGGTYNLGTDAEPTVSMTVTSKSWTDAGVETTLSRTVYGKAALRKPYPDQLVKDETVNGTGIDCKIVLNDFVYPSETISSVSIAAGFHTDNGSGGSGLPSAAQTPTPTNSSTFAYRKPIAMWLNHDLDWVKANTYTVQMAVAHKDFRNGLPVRAVKFIATDLHSNTTSVTVSSMVKRDFTVTGLSAPVFSGDLDFTGLTQGDLVTIDAIIYPWIGDAFQVSVDADTYPSPNLTVLKVLNDRTGAYGTAYAYVDGVGGGTPACHTDPATAAGTPYATVALAAAGLQTYINSTFTRNNVSGGIIRLNEGTHAHSTYSARAVGEIPLIVEAADVANRLTTIYTGANLSNSIPDLLLLRNITLQQTAATQLFFTNSGTNTGNFLLVFDNIRFDRNGYAKYTSWIGAIGRGFYRNCDGDDCGQGTQASTVCKPAIMVGCAAGSLQTATYNAIGCKDLFADVAGGVTNVNNTVPNGVFYGFNKMANTASITIATQNGNRGVAVVGNIIESYAAISTGAITFYATGTTTCENFLDIANTICGNRSLQLYNDIGNYARGGISSLSIHDDFNIKGDVFATNGTYISNWSAIYRVGSKYRAALYGSSDAETPGVGSWLGEVAASGDVAGSNATPIVADYVDDNSYRGSQTGDGDYTPGASTALPQIPEGQTAYPYDLLGRVIPTDGTAYVGAVQQAP